VTDKRETALARWSRLKRADTETGPPAPHDDQLPEAAAVPRQETEVVTPQENRSEAPPEDGETDLPDIADLNAQSDYSAFLREGVSEEIRRKALRVLWRSDPVLANLDGLNDYDEDFRSAGVLAEAVRTAYKAGKGYLSEEGNQTAFNDEVVTENLEKAEEKGTGLEEIETGAAGSAVASGGSNPSGERPSPDDPGAKKSS